MIRKGHICKLFDDKFRPLVNTSPIEPCLVSDKMRRVNRCTSLIHARTRTFGHNGISTKGFALVRILCSDGRGNLVSARVMRPDRSSDADADLVCGNRTGCGAWGSVFLDGIQLIAHEAARNYTGKKEEFH